MTIPCDTDFFNENGYLICPGLVSGERLLRLQSQAAQELATPSEPWELEADLAYPGAPASLAAQGGLTIRRLLDAYHRHPLWSDWASSQAVYSRLQQLFDDTRLMLSLAHHNCLMTKAPHYSSDTGWHQDIRYWSFERPELISVWLALGEEREDNGGLCVIPGSHRIDYASSQYDEKMFFRTDLDENRRWLKKAVALSLDPGDVLFFDCKLLHRASRNYRDQTKLSLVFTYRRQDNTPLPGTRSAQSQDILLAAKNTMV